VNKFVTSLVLSSLLLQPFAYAKANAVKQEQQNDSQGNPKPKPLNRQSGKEGVLNESKSALISVDPLALQSYSEANNNFDIKNYDKVTLKSVILETLSQSNTLKSAQEKVNQIELELKKTYASYHPTLDFEYSLKNTKNHTGDIDLDTKSHSEYDDESYKLTLKQSLYAGGATALKVKSIKSKVEEGKRKFLIILEQEIQKAIKAYFQVLFNYQKVQINEKNMEKLNKILEITQVKYDSGALAIGDLSAVKANIANASSKLITIKSELADSLDFYLYIVGEDFQRTAPFEEDFSLNLTTLEELYEEIEENNLALLNYRLNIQSTKDNLLSVKAKFKPKLDLEMYYKNVLDKEEFETNEEQYVTKLTLSYNIYNGGKDTIDTMRIFSDLQELKFRYQEEIKKIRWEVSKLYNSLLSLDDTIKSTRDEVSASNEMVNAYWEGFQLGEQDLQVLLQGQRQLNSAELNLVKFKQDYLTNLFKLLKEKGELSAFFKIDPEDPHFIDFSNTGKIEQTATLDLTTENNTTRTKDLNATVDEYLDMPKTATFDDVINFRDTFLQADDEKYTLVISDFENNYDAYQFIKRNRLLENAFSYGYFENDGTKIVDNKTKEKLVSISNKIAYGIYETNDAALNAQDNIFELKNSKKYMVMKVKDIKDAYKEYVTGLETKVQPFIIKPKIKKTFITNQEFKHKFLTAPEYYFSINVISVANLTHAQKIVQSENIENDSFVFKYGRNGEWIKIMYGVYPTYNQAFNALSSHPSLMDTYQPVIEKISHKQKLYNKYKEFNKLPKWYLDEQKEKAKKLKEEQEQKEHEELEAQKEALKEEKENNATQIEPLENIVQDVVLDNSTQEPIPEEIPLETKDEANTTQNEISPLLIETPEERKVEPLIENNDSTPTEEKEVNITEAEDFNTTAEVSVVIEESVDFETLIKNADDSQYTITLLKSFPKRVDNFINNTPLPEQSLMKANENVAQVITGLFDTKDEALLEIKQLDEKVKKDAFITKIKTFRDKYDLESIKDSNPQEPIIVITPMKESTEENSSNNDSNTTPLLDKSPILSNKNNITQEENISSVEINSSFNDTIISDENESLGELDEIIKNENKLLADETKAFEEAIKSADDSAYTITLMKSYPNKVDNFIKNNAIPASSLAKTTNNVTQLISGLFTNRDQALKGLNNLSERLKKDAFITKVNSFRKKHHINPTQKTSIAIPTIEQKKEEPKKSSLIYTTKNDFTQTFKNTDKDKYTIYITETKTSNIPNFISTYFLDNNFTTLEASTNKSIVLYGIYDTKEEAINIINNNMHPKMAQKAYAIQIKELQ
jgi:outer membrane protein TolC/septal ring-binding cell division protein DamX